MTSFHHQPEAQHPKSSAIHNYVGRLPHLNARSGHHRGPLVAQGFTALLIISSYA